MTEHFDVVVIGGGTAGLVTASGCARVGRKVALIERTALGGECLWTGCVPTKSLVASARLVQQMRHADAFGLAPHRAAIDSRTIMTSMRHQIRRIEPHDSPEKFRHLGIDVVIGKASLVARNAVEVNGRRLEAKDIVLATGSRTDVPSTEGLAEAGYLDHESFIRQDAFPRSIVILGGGYIGIEFAQMLLRFGCSVTVVEPGPDIVSKEDPAIISRVRNMLVDEGVDIRAGCNVKSVRREGGRKILLVENKTGQQGDIATDEILVATGRRGNIEDLGLENAGVRTERSYVVVNKYLETSASRIWACGDVHGGLQFTHVAAYEAVKLVRNMLFPGRSPVSYEHIPWALFTDPEVGHIGMTEPEAKAAFGDANVHTYECEMAEVDRAIVDRAARGILKLVCNRKGHILGAHAFCANASTLIAPIVLARKKRLKIGELAQLVSPYPSLTDAISRAAKNHYRDLGSSWLGSLGKRIAAWAQ